MKTTKRFSTLELVNYRLSSTTRTVSFDTLDEAVNFAKEQKKRHPRTKKLTGLVYDALDKEVINALL